LERIFSGRKKNRGGVKINPKLFYELDVQPLSSRGIAFLVVIAIAVVIFVGFAVSYGAIGVNSIQTFCKDNGYYQFRYAEGKPYCANSSTTVAETGKEIYCEQRGVPEYSCRFVSEGDLNE